MSKINWVQWTNRNGELKAFAVDASVNEGRSINGSLVPADAVPAEKSTPRDTFCEVILAKREADALARATKLEAKATEKAERAEFKAAARAAKAEAKAAAKAEAKTEPGSIAPPATDARRAAPKPSLRVGKKVSKVVLSGQVLGEFQSDKLVEGLPHVVKVTDKSWAVYQDKKRVAMGLIKPLFEVSPVHA